MREGGHIVIVHNGDLCTCGRRGCWERYASANALIRQTQAAMDANSASGMWELVEGVRSRVDGRTAFEAMRAGDASAKAVVDQYLRYLADGLANFVNIFQPEVICSCPFRGWWRRCASAGRRTATPRSPRPSWATTPALSARRCWGWGGNSFGKERTI